MSRYDPIEFLKEAINMPKITAAIETEMNGVENLSFDKSSSLIEPNFRYAESIPKIKMIFMKPITAYRFTKIPYSEGEKIFV